MENEEVVVNEQESQSQEVQEQTEQPVAEEQAGDISVEESQAAPKKHRKSKKKKAKFIAKVAIVVAVALAAIGGIVVGAGLLTNDNITVVMDYGEVHDNKVVKQMLRKGVKISSLPVLDKEGWVFDGWYRDEECTIQFNENATLNEDITVYGKYKTAEYSVRFFNIDRTLLKSYNEVKHGTDMSKVYTDIPTKTDKSYIYTFVNWVDSQGLPIDLTCVTRNVDAFANYSTEYIDYTLKIENTSTGKINVVRNEVPLTENDKVHYGDELVITYEESDGYDMSYFSVKGAISKDGAFVVNGDVTITYGEKREKLSVIFYDENQTTVLHTLTGLEYNSAAIYPTTPIKESDGAYEYTFECWTDKDGRPVDLSHVTENLEVYVYYTKTRIEYKFTTNAPDRVTVTKEDVVLTADSVFYFGDMLTITTNPPVGSYCKELIVTGATQNRTSYIVTGNVNINYVEEPYRYTVTYYDENKVTFIHAITDLLYGQEAVYTNIPQKPKDKTYEYTFDKWVTSDGVEADFTNITEDMSVYATYTPKYIEYTVTIVNSTAGKISVYRGIELIDGKDTLHYGDKLSIYYETTENFKLKTFTVEGATLTGDKYVVEGDIVITYDEVETFDINFYNYDHSFIYTEEDVEYGTASKYKTVPTRESDSVYSYVFAGWVDDKGDAVDLTNITSSLNVYASFTGEFRKFVLTVQNSTNGKLSILRDGTEISHGSEVSYGDVLVITYELTEGHSLLNFEVIGATEDNGTYIVTGDVTVIFSETLTVYTVNYFDEDKVTLFRTLSVEYGSPAVYSQIPTKENDNTFTYTFAGWVDADGQSVDLTFVRSDLNVYASYTSTYKEYTLTINNATGAALIITKDGVLQTSDSVLHYGDKLEISYVTTEGHTMEDFKVVGATLNEGVYTVVDNVTVYYHELINEYTVTYYDEDKTTVIYTLTGVDYNTEAKYTGIPTKQSDSSYTYAFDKWVDAEGNTAILTNIKQDTSVYATYKSTLREYSIVINKSKTGKVIIKKDGEEITPANTVHYNDKLEIIFETTEGYHIVTSTVTGANLDEGLYSVVGNVVITYEEAINIYTVNFYDEDKMTLLSRKQVQHGSATYYNIVKPADKEFIYTFEDWTNFDGEVVDLISVKSNLNLCPKFAQEYIEYTITIDKTQGSDLRITKGGAVVMESDTVHYGEVLSIVYTIREGYEFVSFETQGLEQDGDNFTVTGNVVIVFREKVLTWDVTVYTTQDDSQVYEVPRNVDIWTNMPYIDSMKNYTNEEYTCGFYTDPEMRDFLPYDAKLTGNITLYTRIATLDKLSFENHYTNNNVDYFYVKAFNDQIPGEVVIPLKKKHTSGSKPVASLKASAFKNCVNMTSIFICNNITNIPTSAFENCPLITELTIPENITAIDRNAVKDCNNLVLINYLAKSAIADYDKYDGYSSTSYYSEDIYMMRGSELGCKVIIGNKVTKVPVRMFMKSNITELEFQEGAICSTIENYAFAGCENLIKIQIPSTVISFGRAFLECVSVKEVYIDTIEQWLGYSMPYASVDSDDYYNGDTSNGWSTYNSYYTNPLNYGANLYVNGALLTDLVIPAGVESIKDYTFKNCDSLQAVIIPEGVKTIGRDAFRYCTNLNSLSIASTVETIGESAFAMCKKLGQINYNATNAKDGNINVAPFEGSGADRCIVNIGDSVTRLNRALFYKSRITEVVFSQNTRCSTIGNYTFNECLRLQDIILPATIKTIYSSAFSEFLRELYNNTTINITAGNYGLSSSVNIIDVGGNSTNRVYIENGFKILVKASKYYLLDYVGSDKNVVLPDYIDGNAYEVADYAFYQNVDIQSITIPATINKIGKNSFVGCTNLKRVFIFDIGKWMQIEFNNSSPLQNGADLYLNDNVVYHIDVPNGITEVKDYTFDGCTSLMSINIPNGTRIGTRAFYNCINLTRVTVPSNLQVIAQYAFYNCKKLTDFAIPSGLTEINSYAFYGCQSLTSAPIPSTLTILGDYAFYDCYMLEQDVTIPSGVAQIGNYAFYNCRRLQSLTLEQGNLTTIGSYAFVSCVKISELLIPEGVTSINANAFVNCYKIEVVSIPSTVRSILYAFSGCISIQTLYINDIGNWTTCSLSSSNSVPVVDSTKVYIDGVLATNIIIPDGITQISSYAFYKFKDLKSIHIPNSVQSIGTSAFESAESLESIIIPEGVEKIKNSTFYNCLSLKSVTIPSSINFVADYAFYNCKALEKVNIADMEKWMQIEFDVYEPTTISSSYSGYANPLYYGADLYLNNQKVTELIVPNSITNILDFTFYNCKSFEYVVIPEGVTAIGKGAFNGCSNIKSISFPSTLKTIGYNAFANCSSLQNIDLSKNVTRIDSYAFYNCKAATSVSFSNVLTTIGSYAFYNCSSLQNLILPDSITSLGSYSFTNCTELENVIIGEGLTRLGSYAFENCTNIKQITLPSTLTQITTAFYNCTGIERVNVDTIEQWLNFSFYVTAERTTGNIISNPLQYGADLYVNDTRVTDLSIIPEDITSIPQYAFYGCYGFTEITVPNYIKSIGKYAFGKNSNLTKVVLHSAISSMANSFNGCYKLVDVVIEDGIQTISDGAFENCTAIKSIAFPSSVKTIGVEAFKGCSGLVLVTLPNELTTIKERAFQNCKSIITIELPSSLKTIGDNAFAGTTYLKEVRNASALEVKAGSFGIGASVKIIKTGESQYITEGEFIFSKTQTTGEGEDIKYDYVLVGYTGKSTNVILPDLVKGNPYSIKEELFYNNDYITSVTISRNVLKIGARAFAGCDNLTRIVYNAISADNENTSSLNSNNPFYGTGSKTTCVLQIGSLVTYIPNNLFRASNISEIVFGSRTGDCLEMGKYVFAECDYIINVEIIPLINVGEYAFYECDNLTSVVSKELTTLGANSFRNCKKLQSVILQGTAEIKNGAFYSCAAITNLNLGFGLQHIKENAFVGCNGLVDIVLPTGLSSIGSAAFKDCFNLKSIVLPDTLDTIADDVFKNTPQLLEVFNNSAYVFLEMGSCALSLDVSIVNYACVNPIIERDGLRFVEFNKKYYLIEYVGFDTDIVLPNNINGQSYQIRSYAFYNLDFIRSITIPTGVTAIGDYAFKDCDNLETVIIGEEVGSIGEQAFYSCDNLMQIDIGVGLSSIGNEAFRYCSNLTNVTILEGLTKIGNYTFADCTKLETILLSSGLKTIGSNAFQNCSSLLGIDIPVGVTSIGNYVFENCSSMTYVNVPQGLTNIGDYAFRKCSNLLEIIIPEGVTYLGPDVFKDCVSLKTIYLPKTLRTIKTQAFYGCSSLELMDIPVGVSTLENYTFYNCSSLRQISIPSTIISVGKYVFSGCTSLEKINLPERITYISENTFYNCKSLIEVLIPVGVTSIGDYAFYGCSSLKEIDIPETVNEIGKYAFADCSYLQQITIPDAVTAISQALFSNCIRLKWAQIPNTVKTIGANAFYNCNCLEWFIIPEGVKTIENETFYQCWDMEWITIASTVTKIGNKAFYRCETLKELTLPVAVKYIGSDAFRRCIDLLEVVIPGAITFIGNRAFDDCELLDKVVINNVYVYERTMLMNQGRLLENATKVYIQKAVADSIPNINEYMHSQNYTFDARQLEYIDGREYYVFYKEDINA